MMAEVFFLPVDVKRIDEKHALLARYEKLLDKLITPAMVKDKTVAIKLHLGGHHGYSHVHPAFVTRTVNRVKDCGGRPFITDHRRDNRIAGVIPEALGCPIYHATGLKDRYAYTVKTGSKLLPTVQIAGYIRDADVLINLSHAKGHGMCGFGAAIKNLGMGAVTGKSRGDIHRLQDKEFKWHKDKCTHCKRCVQMCEHQALKFNKEGELQNDTHFCTLCLHCMTLCPSKAITVGMAGWGYFQKGLALAARAALAGFEKGRMLHINVALNITSICDCWGMSLPSIMPDVGVFASTDPCAVDQASIDHMDAKDVFPGSLTEGVSVAPGNKHILERIWGKDPYYQVREGERLGIGSAKYKLTTIR
jgi:uncharacterized protein